MPKYLWSYKSRAGSAICQEYYHYGSAKSCRFAVRHHRFYSPSIDLQLIVIFFSVRHCFAVFLGCFAVCPHRFAVHRLRLAVLRCFAINIC
ncbi:hypothetical protein BC936DRAFT_143387, partial [Jimgerdemannia flammicorona]